MHRVLNRQLRRVGLSFDQMPVDLNQWQDFLKSIEEAYLQDDQGRYLLERSLDISSKEMAQRLKQNQELHLQLAQANKLVSLGTLASGIAHELNNPLQAIKGYMEILIRKDVDRNQQLSHYERVRKLCDRMGSTIKHLLRLARKSQDNERKALPLLIP